jgi:hypothetical protein
MQKALSRGPDISEVGQSISYVDGFDMYAGAEADLMIPTNSISSMMLKVFKDSRCASGEEK